MPTGATPQSWKPQRRKDMRKWMHQNKPWLKSTGPKTAKGKANSAMRGLKHGRCSAAVRNAASAAYALKEMESELLRE